MLVAVRTAAPCAAERAGRFGLGLLPGCAAPRVDCRRADQRTPKLAPKKELIRTWKIRPGDLVEVICGKEGMKRMRGEVLMVDFLRNMLKVKGVNLRKLRDEDGNYKMIEKKIHYSNCALVDPVLSKPTRVGLTFTEEGGAIRISHLSGHVIPWPDPPKRSEVPLIASDGPKDTPPEKALEKTYDYHADSEAIRLARLELVLGKAPGSGRARPGFPSLRGHLEKGGLFGIGIATTAAMEDRDEGDCSGRSAFDMEFAALRSTLSKTFQLSCETTVQGDDVAVTALQSLRRMCRRGDAETVAQLAQLARASRDRPERPADGRGDDGVHRCDRGPLPFSLFRPEAGRCTAPFSIHARARAEACAFSRVPRESTGPFRAASSTTPSGMGILKDDGFPLADFLPSLPFLARRDHQAEPKAAEASGGSGAAADEAFDAADELEKGLSPSRAGAGAALRRPLGRAGGLRRYFAIRQEGSEEVLLMSETHEVLLWAVPCASSDGAVRRMEFFCSAPGGAGPRRKPDFVLARAEGGGDDWALSQTWCECCAHRPRHLTCASMGKGQQVARLLHTRQKAGEAWVHSMDAWLPPVLADGTASDWCPALLGADLGPAWRSAASSPSRATSAACSPRRSAQSSPRRHPAAPGSRLGGLGQRPSGFSLADVYAGLADVHGGAALSGGAPQVPGQESPAEAEGASPSRGRSPCSSAGAAEDPICLRTRLPVWDQEVKCLVLNFHNVSKLEVSPRNFMLVHSSGTGDDRVVFQHARVGPKTFCMDVGAPLGVVQAFAIGMASSDWD
ncbi:unnamed protein product [Prorocentrum cordatum]|uniref:Tubby C-terminal domain-containing protein n=1 Tax=Prorocentrum cordatum TaxID=2364126 RepID=A0ABN9THD5_9DINO|nr:unnamed protein product [Polarella glacialis]